MHRHSAVKLLLLMFALILVGPQITSKGQKDLQQKATVASAPRTRIAAGLQAAGPIQGEIRENPKDGLKYVWIPPGTFMMGCSQGDNECGSREKPAHQVTITHGFWIGQTPVTVGAYKRFAGASGRSMPPEPALLGRPPKPGWVNNAMPIVKVTWDNAQAYCGWTGGRLPTEAEWEFAARGGSTEARYGPINEVAWYADNSGLQPLDSTRIMQEDPQNYAQPLIKNGNGPHEVGQKRPNGLGLFDMLGNVWEWVNDWYDEDYYHNSPPKDPKGPADSGMRVLRGGSWVVIPSVVRVSYRDSLPPAGTNYDFGFRCAEEAGNL